MNSQDEQPLLSKPISEITIDQMDQHYITRVKWYLEHDLQCRMIPLSGQRGYLIQFPANTTEEVYAGQSTQWTYRTTIRLPNGITFTKYVLSPLNPTQHSQTMLAFPNAVLDGPEPPAQG